MKKILLLEFILVLASQIVYPQVPLNYKNNSEKLETKVENILQQLTLEEKIGMCSGAVPEMAFKGVERLGIPNVQCCDGPRGPNIAGSATAFPCGLLFGATWNPDIVYKAGKIQGEETRSIGRSVLLGPANNILRDPLGGRFFEYYTEDPYLNSRITVAHVKGIQDMGVAACLKHYACNNREFNRNEYMSMVDDRTMHEIYLPAYKAAVEEAKVWSIMTSANGMNGEFVSDSKKMLIDILKGDWGFDGFVITDWLQTRSTDKAALAGLDISMPGGEGCGFGKPLLEAVNEGRIPITIIDDKVRRILRIYGRIGILDGVDLAKGNEHNTVEHQKIAREVAEEGIVLLKNNNNTLPLNLEKVKKVLVTGPNADRLFCVGGMGGSSSIASPYEVTQLQGVVNIMGKDNVDYFSTERLGGYSIIPATFMKADENGVRGWMATYHSEGEHTPVTRIEPEIDFMWEMKSPDKSISPESFSANFQGWVIPPVDGIYTLRLTAGGWCAVFPEGCYGAPTFVADSSKDGLGTVTATIQLQKDVPYFFCINYSKIKGNDAALRLEWKLPESSSQQQEVEDLLFRARKADAVIFVGGLDHSLDTEGRDRFTMDFPKDQEILINKLAAENSNLVVVLINGSPMQVGGWLPNVPAVVEAWYPGMEGGNAVADVLFGNINPSGRIPFTWPKKLEDSPSHKLGHEDKDYVYYDEKLMVGYRYYDTKNIEPEFPFGYGLSYTSFKYEKMKLSEGHDNSVKVSVSLKNEGSHDGYETVQVYVKPINPSIDRPIHELKAFKKVFMKANQTLSVDFELKADAFSFYNIDRKEWQVDKCKYEIEVGTSSRNIFLRKSVAL